MKIYKFGGASLKIPGNLNTLIKIIKDEKDLILVVSAIDKTTNALEKLIDACFNNYPEKEEIFSKIKSFHYKYLNECFDFKCPLNIVNDFENIIQKLENFVHTTPDNDFDRFYDSIICFGELLSSFIVSNSLKYKGIDNNLIDVRKILFTDSNYRDAKILWEESENKLKNSGIVFSGITILQGFIGEDKNGITTSLGREGSDYTAAGLAYLLNAESVTIWKDVPGIMNADPSWCDFAEKLTEISYREAIELAFYGAKVIHPKTIKPLENKSIPLYVKSFLNPLDSGTVVKKLNYKLNLVPIYILKENQILLSVSPKDFSFIVEENLSKIFSLFAQYKIKVNVMQNSAISFSVSIDGNNRYFEKLIEDLRTEFIVKYNSELELITIRYYNDQAIEKMTSGKKILLQQKSRNTARFVLEKF